MDVFIASRLHSGIFALGMRIPTLFVGYLHKTKGVLEAIGLNDYNIDLANVTASNLIEKIQQIWENRDQLKEQIEIKMIQVENDLSEFPAEIRKAFQFYDNLKSFKSYAVWISVVTAAVPNCSELKLARELNKLPNCQVRICAFYSVGTETEKKWQKDLQDEGIPTFFVSEWKGYNNFNKFIKGVRKLIAEIADYHPDVAHSHFQLGTLAAVILKFFKKTKTAYRTSHIRKEWDKGKWTWMLFPMFINRIFPNYLDGEIGVSQAVCDYLVSRRPDKIDSDKIHLIYNGIDIDEITDKGKEALKRR